jgi:hypothetical protein
MNNQDNIPWNWNNLVIAQLPIHQQPVVPPLNDEQIQQIFAMLAEQQNQQPPQEHVVYMNIGEFVDEFIQSLEHILLMYQDEPAEEPQLGYDPRVGWYSRLDEMFDHVSRHVLGHRGTWQPHQELRELLEPIFMARDRMGRHITEEEAQHLLDGLINFRDIHG